MEASAAAPMGLGKQHSVTSKHDELRKSLVNIEAAAAQARRATMTSLASFKIRQSAT